MAKITSTPTRNDFIGNPIVYSVQSATAAVGSSFHRVKFRVPVKQDGVLKKEFILSQSIAGVGSEVVDFDISSCVRAVAETYISTLHPLTNGQTVTYPVFSVTPSAFDVYVQNNAEITGREEQATEIKTRLGSYTDYERHQTNITTTLSRKPSDIELVCPGDIIVYPIFKSDNLTTQSITQEIPTNAVIGSTITINGRKYYVERPRRGSTVFQFLNSRGCIESIRAWGLTAETAKSEDKTTVISRFERFSQFSRSVVTKYSKPTEIQMSSGPVSPQWAQWWAYEFCRATHIWMQSGTLWIPCNVTPSGSTKLLDLSKTELLSIDFTVTPDLNGPLW